LAVYVGQTSPDDGTVAGDVRTVLSVLSAAIDDDGKDIELPPKATAPNARARTLP
jgi:hypothetical protein